MATLEFFWDPGSPYSYLASTQIEGLVARTGVEVVWRPVLVGVIMKAAGTHPNIESPAKGAYMMQDLALCARRYGVPLRRPDPFPTSPVIAERLALAAPPALQPALARGIMRAHWGEGRDIAQPEVLRAVVETLGLDSAAVFARTQDPEIKNTLRANTDEAVARGAFGAPTFFLGAQMFWGCDRLPHIEEILRGELVAE